MENGTQTLLEMCATCAHTKASHPEDGPCAETWTVDEGQREVRCRCSEYWAKRRDLEDGMPVTERQVGFGGSVDLELDRRVTSEFWDVGQVWDGMTSGEKREGFGAVVRAGGAA